MGKEARRVSFGDCIKRSCHWCGEFKK